MLDTVMVLWMRSRYGRFLQTLAAFFLLFTGICALILLVMASGVKWPGLAVTAGPPIFSATAGTAAGLTPAIVPVIVQNPTPQATNRPGGVRRAGTRPGSAPVLFPPPDGPALFP